MSYDYKKKDKYRQKEKNAQKNLLENDIPAN